MLTILVMDEFFLVSCRCLTAVYLDEGILMYVSNENSTSGVSNSTTNSNTTENSNSSDFFKDMLSNVMIRQSAKMEFFSKSVQLTESSALKSFSRRYQEQANYTFKANTSALISNIQGYFESSLSFTSSFAMLEQWLSKENDVQKTLIDYLLDMSKDQPESTAGAVSELFGVQAEVQNILASIRESSAMSSTFVSSAVTAINMEVDTFGAESVFGSLSMEVKMQKIEQYSVDTCAEEDLFENGGDMIEFEGKYVKISVFLKFIDPIVLDMNGDGLDLRSIEDGVIYDIKGDGSEVQTGFVQGDDALLFLDSNGDGYCTSGKELFGDQFGADNGFAALAEYDDNNDDVIDSQDEVYKELKVWNDLNGDGKSDTDEIRTLEAAGVSSIDLGYEDISEENAGNKVTQQSTFTRSDGTLSRAVDVQFQYSEYNIFDY